MILFEKTSQKNPQLFEGFPAASHRGRLCKHDKCHKYQLTVCFCLQGANASALEKEIGPEQFPVNEHYFGLVNVSVRGDRSFAGTPRLFCPSVCLTLSFLFSSLETPATVTRCCRLCISVARSGRRCWRTRWVRRETPQPCPAAVCLSSGLHGGRAARVEQNALKHPGKSLKVLLCYVWEDVGVGWDIQVFSGVLLKCSAAQLSTFTRCAWRAVSVVAELPCVWVWARRSRADRKLHVHGCR